MSYQLRACPRCRGDVSVLRDRDTVTRSCMACGWMKEEAVVAADLHPDISPEQARYDTITCLYREQGMPVEKIKGMMFVSERTVWRAVSQGTPRRVRTA